MNFQRAWPEGQYRLARRDWLRFCAAGAVGALTSGWFAALADEAARQPRRRKACILLWMSGGPSQMDTFDLKPGHANGGPYKEIETTVPGIKISEHLPQLAQQADQLTIIRSMTSKEGDHSRATSFAHAGYLAQGPIRYPTFGSLIANQLGREDAELPDFVSIAPNRALSPTAYDPGFLGARCAADGRRRIRRGRQCGTESRRSPTAGERHAGALGFATRKAAIAESEVLRRVSRTARIELPGRL